MQRYASGDDAAFGDLYDELTPRLYRFIMRIVRDRGRAEDLVQQTMLQMHCARGSFIVGSKVLPWAFAIIRRLFLDQRRRRQIDLLGLDDEDAFLQQQSNHPGPEESAQSRELGRLVQRELSRLSPSQRAAVELVYYGQMSHAEAAEALGVTVASIKLRVHRAGHAMRSAFDAFADASLDQ
jgi:RNA polymerase sigma-70 factor (ECF subfamily)